MVVEGCSGPADGGGCLGCGAPLGAFVCGDGEFSGDGVWVGAVGEGADFDPSVLEFVDGVQGFDLLVIAARAKYGTRRVGSILTDLGALYSELNERIKQDETASPLVTTRAYRAVGQASEATKQLQTPTN